jgi:hypothetical protein
MYTVVVSTAVAMVIPLYRQSFAVPAPYSEWQSSSRGSDAGYQLRRRGDFVFLQNLS